MLKLYAHITRTNNVSTKILQSTTLEKRRWGRYKKKITDNVTEWIRRSFRETQTLARPRNMWRQLNKDPTTTTCLLVSAAAACHALTTAAVVEDLVPFIFIYLLVAPIFYLYARPIKEILIT